MLSRYGKWINTWPRWLIAVGVMSVYVMPMAGLIGVVIVAQFFAFGSINEHGVATLLLLGAMLIGSVFYGLGEVWLNLDPRGDAFKLGLISGCGMVTAFYVMASLSRATLLPITLVGVCAAVGFSVVIAALWRYGFVGSDEPKAGPT